MKVKIGLCLDCTDGLERPLIAKRCQMHYWQFRAQKKTHDPKPKKPIPPISEKRLKQNAEYRKVRDKFMAKHPICQARLQGCTVKATDLHHAKGRVGDLLTDVRHFKALCRACHSFIEINPKFARENGFSDNRLTN